MKITQNKNVTIITDLLPLAVIIAMTIIVSVVCKSYVPHYNNEIHDLTAGWTSENGAELSIDSLPTGDITVTHDLSNIPLDRKRLCFETTHTFVTAKFDGVTMYDFHPSQEAILGKSYGMYIHLIPIPPDASSVSLTLHPLYNGTSAVVSNISVEDGAMFMADLYHSGLPNFALCMIISFFGAVMLVIGFATLRTFESSAVNFFSLGSFAVIVGIWSANDTMIFQVFTQRPEIARFVNYICLMFLAYLPVSFLASVTNHRNTVMLPIVYGLTFANFIITMILSVLNIKDIREMLLFSHINVAVAMCTGVYLMIRAVKKKTCAPNILHNVITGMSSVVIGVSIDMLRFRLFPSSPLGASLFTRLGTLIFIVLMGIHLVHERTRLAIEQGQTEIIRKMAYTDGLTELGNRAAFHEKEGEIRRSRTDCIIIQFDINFLKKSQRCIRTRRGRQTHHKRSAYYT